MGKKETIAKMKGYKQTKLGRIPMEWEVRKLGDLGGFLKGKGILKEQLSEKGLPCIRYGEIYTIHDFVIKEFHSFISKEVAKESQPIFHNDILFAGSGETLEDIGKAVAYIGKEEAYAGGDVVILRTGKKNHSEYLSYVLNTDTANRQKRKLGQGHSVVHIYASDLADLIVPVPPLPEQQKIARILSTWDKAIEKTELLIAQKQQLKKGLMQQLLTGKVRFKEFVKSKKMKKTRLGLIPEDWEVMVLSDLTSTFRSGLGITSENISEKGRYAVYGGNGLRGYTNSFTHEGDFFLIGRQGALCGNIVKITGKNYISEHAIAVQANESNDNFFLAYKLEFVDLNRLSESSAQPGLSVDKLLKLRISTPTLKEQKRIGSIISFIDGNILTLNQNLLKLNMQKKGIMQKLLTGQVRVKLK
ncbi:MAG: restriction endonuclease subunit S [Cytophagales bacterium]|nr:restriction endonuclease subunit S [Cytophagales bacterium]MCA6392567.1 restriction endonuclease subunit S [Cytophagales bacterium]MCA6396640.1 restriction endonuclease subunit S [Cytophagales bacterium]MCA6401661.1 restriction endonuclease subunit S [Cytophagales bacterium]MCA6407296.1 restriction endonuclease subunit S [Cytophagales bacterium]